MDLKTPGSETSLLYTMPSRAPTGNGGFPLFLFDLGIPKPLKTKGFGLETDQSEAGFGLGIKN